MRAPPAPKKRGARSARKGCASARKCAGVRCRRVIRRPVRRRACRRWPRPAMNMKRFGVMARFDCQTHPCREFCLKNAATAIGARHKATPLKKSANIAPTTDRRGHGFDSFQWRIWLSRASKSRPVSENFRDAHWRPCIARKKRTHIPSASPTKARIIYARHHFSSNPPRRSQRKIAKMVHPASAAIGRMIKMKPMRFIGETNCRRV